MKQLLAELNERLLTKPEELDLEGLLKFSHKLLNLLCRFGESLVGAYALIAELQGDLRKAKNLPAKPADKASSPKAAPPATGPKPDKKPGKDADKRSDHSSNSEREQREPPKPRQKRDKNAVLLPVSETVILGIPADQLPAGAVPHGYEDRLVQDLSVLVKVICYRRMRYRVPGSGKSFLAPLPPGTFGAFGPGITVHSNALVHGFGMSQRAVHAYFQDLGISISAGKISHLVTQGTEAFRQEFEEAVREAWRLCPWRGLDHTSTKVKGKSHCANLFVDPLCTVFQTVGSGSRVEVVRALRLGKPLEYRLDEQALSHMKAWRVPGGVLDRLAAMKLEPEHTEETAFVKWLDLRFPTLADKHIGNIRAACALSATRVDPECRLSRCLLTDQASVFNGLADEHANCWVHDGRHYQKLSPIHPGDQLALKKFKKRYWDYYHELTKYRENPTQAEADRLRKAFEKLASTKSRYAGLQECINRTSGNRERLLLVLKHPELPLNTNAVELAARARVRRRDVSFGPQSARGCRAWDRMQGLKMTLGQHGIRFTEFLQDRVHEVRKIPDLIAVVRRKAAELEIGKSWEPGWVPPG